MREIILFITLFFMSLSGVFPADTNPDGSIKILPFSKNQEQEIRELSEKINDLHKRFLEKLPYLKKKKLSTDSEYYDEYNVSRTFELGSFDKYFLVELIDVKFSGTALGSVSFRNEKTRMGNRKLNTKTVQELINKNPASGTVEDLELKITVTDEGAPVETVYSLKTVRDPAMRVRLVRSYFYYLFEAIQRIDRKMMTEINEGEVRINNIFRELK